MIPTKIVLSVLTNTGLVAMGSLLGVTATLVVLDAPALAALVIITLVVAPVLAVGISKVSGQQEELIRENERTKEIIKRTREDLAESRAAMHEDAEADE